MRALVAISLLVTPIALSGCAGDDAEAKTVIAPAPVIRTAKIEATTYVPVAELTGSLDPIASVQLGFNVPGRIDALLVSRGDVVSEGDPLAKLDGALAQSQLAQAEAGKSAAEAQVEAADTSWARIDKMGDAVSGQQRTEAKMQVSGAHAQLDQATAAVKLARTNLGYHTLKAPISGLVTSAPDNVGALVGAGSPMFVIEDLSALRVKGSLPEEMGWVTAGMAVEVLPGTPGATEAVPAVVDLVIPSLDVATRRIPVEIRVDSPPSTLRAHGFARVTIRGEPTPGFLIPSGALVARPDFAVLVQDAPGGSPRRVAVSVLEDRGDHVVIGGDLAEGLTVVVDPPHGYGE